MSHSNLIRPLVLLTTCLFLAPVSHAEDPVSGSFMLDTELYRGLEAEFGDVQVEEDGVGGLHVRVVLDPAVAGDDARVHRVYLSMPEWPEGLSVAPDDPDAMRISLHHQHHAWQTMGAEFGAVVKVTSRSDRRRHHWFRPRAPVHEVGFTLTADKPLMLASMLGMTATWRDVVVQIAVDVHGLDLGRRHHAPGLLAGLFDADLPPDDGEDPGPDDGEDPGPDDGEDPGPGPGPGAGELPLPDDGIVPPGCFGVIDPATNTVTSIFCP
jgi:hypothetical protein